MRHNEVRNSFAKFLSDVCLDGRMGPHIQPLQSETFATKTTANEDVVLRLDIKISLDIFGESRLTKTYFDEQEVALKAVAKSIGIRSRIERTIMDILMLRMQRFVRMSVLALVEFFHHLQKR